ncbi:NAD-dependent epimerase/dehydratase family protein [Pararhizobium sp. A13]|uniref:NAD-dependent epimerase/dehydratase family protein n=1 Tax=Pararhizobium sp. A13 TaxID=3133975 RepID=UPI00311ACFDA
MRNRRILITGGAGFIGTHLAEHLAGKYELILLDNFRRNSLQSTNLLEHEGISIVEADVLDQSAMFDVTEHVDVVVHLAAIAGVNSYYEESLRTLQVNILGTVNLLEASARRGVSQFIDFSTSEVFGPDAMWVTEESPHGIGPVSDRRWVYAASKLASEHFTLRYGEQYGFSCTCVRPFNIYGPRQTGEGAIGNFLRAALVGEPLNVYNDGSPIRAWCYVTDIVEAIAAIIARPEAAVGQSFNIGNPREIETTLGLARRIARLVPGTEICHVRMERAEVRARVPSIEKAQRMLGFEPKIDLDEGLRRTLEWFSRRTSDENCGHRSGQDGVAARLPVRG